MAQDYDFSLLNDTLNRLNQNMSKIYGSSDSFKPSNENSGGFGNGTRYVKQAMKSTANNMLSASKVLHGSTDDLHSFFRKVVGWGIAGEVFDHIIESGRNLVHSYNRLSDVGQRFGGSMFTMAAAAGRYGLSLDEFTKNIERNSTVTAYFSNQQSNTANAFFSLQQHVRENLKQFGFYGMTLSQLNDATGDYMTTLMNSGSLSQLNAIQQQNNTQQMLRTVTSFSQAVGKSRTEIINEAKGLLNDPGVLSAIQGGSRQMVASRQQAANMAMIGFNALSPILGSTFAELIRARGLWQVDIPNNPLFHAMQQMGALGQIAPMARMAGGALNGRHVNTLSMLQMIHNIDKFWDSNRGASLLAIMGRDPSQRANVELIQTMLAQTRAFVESRKDMLRTEKRLRLDKVVNDLGAQLTDSFNTFSSNLQMITGNFTFGFYQSFNKIMPDFSHNSETVKEFERALKGLGTALGSMMAKFLTPANLTAFAHMLLHISTVITEKLPYAIHIIEWFFEKLEGIFKFIKNIVSDLGWKGTLAAGAGLWVGKKIISNVFKHFFSKGIFYVKNAVIMGGGSGGVKGLLSNLFKGGGAAEGAAAEGEVAAGGTALRGLVVGVAEMFGISEGAIGTIGAIISAATGILPIVSGLTGIALLLHWLNPVKTKAQIAAAKHVRDTLSPFAADPNSFQNQLQRSSALQLFKYEERQKEKDEKKKAELEAQLQSGKGNHEELLKKIHAVLDDIKRINAIQAGLQKQNNNTLDKQHHRRSPLLPSAPSPSAIG